MQFCVIVLAAPYQSEGADSALAFCRALLAAGHGLVRVFFYADGVHCATRLHTAPQDDRDTGAGWQALARERGIDLVACVATAQRRGLVDDTEAARHGKDATNLAPGFRIAGLGQLCTAIEQADRVVTFGPSH